MREVREQCYPDVMLFLVGNKSDLVHERQVTKSMALEFMQEYGIKYFTETSAKSGVNVNQLFFNASKFLYNQMRGQDNASDSQSSFSGSQSRSTYDISPFGSRVNSSNFPALQGKYVDDTRL
jgi:GTPase SAR1 family protein